MFRKLRLRVEPVPDGGWVLLIDHDRQGGPYPRKRDATLAAREYLKRHGGGELLIKNLSGRLTERDSVPAP